MTIKCFLIYRISVSEVEAIIEGKEEEASSGDEVASVLTVATTTTVATEATGENKSKKK